MQGHFSGRSLSFAYGVLSRLGVAESRPVDGGTGAFSRGWAAVTIHSGGR